MKSKPAPTELDIPEGVRQADIGIEVFRAFVADGALHVTFDPVTFAHDTSEWGRLLADSAQHIAAAVALSGQLDTREALAAIQSGFEQALAAEAAAPSPGRVGHIKRGRHH